MPQAEAAQQEGTAGVQALINAGNGAALAAYSQLTGQGFTATDTADPDPIDTHLVVGCWGDETIRQGLSFAGISGAGYSQFTVPGFCWNHQNLTSYGSSSTDAAEETSQDPPFCWASSPSSATDYWFNRDTWRRATLILQFGFDIPPFGCSDTSTWGEWMGYGRQNSPGGSTYYSKWDKHWVNDGSGMP